MKALCTCFHPYTPWGSICKFFEPFHHFVMVLWILKFMKTMNFLDKGNFLSRYFWTCVLDGGTHNVSGCIHAHWKFVELHNVTMKFWGPLKLHPKGHTTDNWDWILCGHGPSGVVVCETHVNWLSTECYFITILLFTWTLVHDNFQYVKGWETLKCHSLLVLC